MTGEEAEEPELTLANGLEIGVTGLAGDKGDKEVSEEAREEEKKEREDDDEDEEDDGIPEQLTLCLRRGGRCPLLLLLNLCSSALWIK